MKQLSLILSIIAVGLSGVLLFMHLKENGSMKQVVTPATIGTNIQPAIVQRIAYFQLDSLQVHYTYFKEALAKLKAKEESINGELATIEKSYQKKIGEWQQRGSNMSQTEQEAANREYQQMQQNYQSRKQEMEQSLETLKNSLLVDVRKKIDEYLIEYNKEKKFAFIFSNDPNLIFYKDSTFDITTELLSGLNQPVKK